MAESGDAVTILLKVALLLLAARLGGEAARRLRQPAVAGEIVVGLLLGPSLLGIVTLQGTGLPSTAADLLRFNETAVLNALATLGVLLLLFQVGLESSLKGFGRVGASAGLVGLYGVVFSVALGYGASWAFSEFLGWTVTETALEQPHLLHLFVGATLAATSVGITARVLRELGVLASTESQIILGAAVIDDILGLVILAVVAGLVLDPSAVTAFGVGRILLLAVGFVAVAVLVGPKVMPRLFSGLERWFGGQYELLGFGIVLMIAASALAEWAGLAAIIGAFAAGLALSSSKPGHRIFVEAQPVASLFVSVFFVLLGVRVDLSGLTGSTAALVIALSIVLTAIAILAKLLCGFGVVRTTASKLLVGVGMVPRGEVGLIFAVFGLDHDLIADWQYATIVLVVLATTLAAPPWLKALTGRFTTAPPSAEAEALSHALDR